MNTLNQEQLREIYNSLPEDIQNTMGSAETSATVQRIAKNYGLSIDQMGELAEEIGLTMLGVHTLTDMPKNIALALGGDLTVGNSIYRDINGSIFLKVRANLERVHDLRVANPLITYASKATTTIGATTEVPEVKLPEGSLTSGTAEKSPTEVRLPSGSRTSNTPSAPESLPPHKTEADPYRETPE